MNISNPVVAHFEMNTLNPWLEIKLLSFPTWGLEIKLSNFPTKGFDFEISNFPT